MRIESLTTRKPPVKGMSGSGVRVWLRSGPQGRAEQGEKSAGPAESAPKSGRAEKPPMRRATAVDKRLGSARQPESQGNRRFRAAGSSGQPLRQRRERQSASRGSRFKRGGRRTTNKRMDGRPTACVESSAGGGVRFESPARDHRTVSGTSAPRARFRSRRQRWVREPASSGSRRLMRPRSHAGTSGGSPLSGR